MSIFIAASSINIQWNGALTFKSIANLAPLFFAIDLNESTDSLLPLITTWPSELSLAISQTPSFLKSLRIFSISFIFNPIIAVILPFPLLSDLFINSPLYFTNFTTDSKSRTPDA